MGGKKRESLFFIGCIGNAGAQAVCCCTVMLQLLADTTLMSNEYIIHIVRNRQTI